MPEARPKFFCYGRGGVGRDVEPPDGARGRCEASGEARSSARGDGARGGGIDERPFGEMSGAASDAPRVRTIAEQIGEFPLGDKL